VGDRAGTDVGHDLHVAMRMRREAALRADRVVVPHADPAPAHPLGVVIAREREMVVGIEPAVIGVAEAIEGADIDHGADLGRRGGASSVSDVTGEDVSGDECVDAGSWQSWQRHLRAGARVRARRTVKRAAR
jgi:hypothetical protein